MVRIQFAIDLHYELGFQGADFVFNIHAAKTANQTIINEQLVISQQVPHTIQTDPATCTRYLRLTGAPGPLHITYKAMAEPLLPVRPARRPGDERIRPPAQGLSPG